MEWNDQNKRTDVNEDGSTVWRIDTEYCNTDSWSKSQFIAIAQEWDPSPYQIQESRHQRLLNLGGELDTEAQEMCSPWYVLVWTGIQLEWAVNTSSIEAKDKASQLHTESRAKERAFQLHIETMKPVHDDWIMQSGLHGMALKPALHMKL